MKSDGMHIVSEWEDNIVFDSDDPDFCNGPPQQPIRQTAVLTTSLHLRQFLLKVPSTMSASVQQPHLAELCTPLGRTSISMSSSLSDLVGSPIDVSSSDAVLTIEELRAQLGSCFSCGVMWAEEHVSLDCSECGGYSTKRPCPLCDGGCGQTWKRDFTMSHACGKARWQGVCPNFPTTAQAHIQAPAKIITNNNHHHHHHHLSNTHPQTCGASQILAQELCARLEKLSSQPQT